MFDEKARIAYCSKELEPRRVRNRRAKAKVMATIVEREVLLKEFSRAYKPSNGSSRSVAMWGFYPVQAERVRFDWMKP